MKLDRLLSIVMILSNRRIVQAKELADLFDVSVRTIYRDIDAINLAGIPVVSYQGMGGGIGISDSFKIDKNVLSQDDILSILGALNGIKSTLGDSKLYGTIEKIKGLIPEHKAGEYKEKASQLLIDLSPWEGSDISSDRVKSIKKCIEECIVMSFEYSNSSGIVTRRDVEPLCLILKVNSWYLYAFCRERKDFRTFKLSRMRDIKISDEVFTKRDITLERLQWAAEDENSIFHHIVLRFKPNLKILIEEKFGKENTALDEYGYVIVKIFYPVDNWLYSMILSYGEDVEVISPESLRDLIKNKINLMKNIYFPCE